MISRNPEFRAVGCEVVHSVEEALELTKDEDEVFVDRGGDDLQEIMG